MPLEEYQSNVQSKQRNHSVERSHTYKHKIDMNTHEHRYNIFIFTVCIDIKNLKSHNIHLLKINQKR